MIVEKYLIPFLHCSPYYYLAVSWIYFNRKWQPHNRFTNENRQYVGNLERLWIDYEHFRCIDQVWVYSHY